MIRLATMPLDDYVRGVVYAESPSSWPLQELEAQAIAARSYADSLRLADNPLYDICDSTYCQVFGGTQVTVHGKTTWLEPAAGQAATDPVAQTADTILVSAATPVFAQFSASNGGWTAGGDPSYGPVRAGPLGRRQRGPVPLLDGHPQRRRPIEAAYGFKRLDVPDRHLARRDDGPVGRPGARRPAGRDRAERASRCRSLVTDQGDLRRSACARRSGSHG